MALLRCGSAWLARDKGTCGGGNVSLSHQAFADQERRDPDTLELRKVIWGV
jgi:hypothetical protein